MFHSVKEEKCYQVTFSAAFENVDRVCNEVERILTNHHLQQWNFDIQLGIREALNNAVKHGSRLDSEKEVFLRLQIETNKIIIRVKDSGKGFDWEHRPLQPSTCSCGKGLVIMNAFFQEVHYNSIGNELELIKKTI